MATDLSDILQFLSTTIRDDREDKRYEAQNLLQMLQLTLTTKSGVLKTQLNNASRKEINLQTIYDEKNQELADVTGELTDFSEYQPDASLDILDMYKSPILDSYETAINDIRTNNNRLNVGIKEIDKKLQTIDKVQDFFGGKLGTTFKGGISDEQWDYEDFGYDAKSKTWNDAKLKVVLNLAAGDPIPEHVKKLIQTEQLGIDVKLTELNKSLDAAAMSAIDLKIKEYTAKDLDSEAFATAETIADLNTGVSTILDPIIGSLHSSSFAPVLKLNQDYNDAVLSGDLEAVKKSKKALDDAKIDIGHQINVGGDYDNDKDNKELGSKLLLGVEAYYNSMTTPGMDLRKILPYIDGLEEIYRRQQAYDNKLQIHIKNKTVGSDEYKELYGNYETFKDNVSQLTHWSWDEYTTNIKTLMATGELIKTESILMLNQTIGEQDKEKLEKKKKTEIELKLKQAQAPGLDIKKLYKEYTDSFTDSTQIDLTFEEFKQTYHGSGIAGGPLQGDPNFQHGYDYSEFPYLEEMIDGEHGIDTNADGIPDALDYDKDGIPDNPLTFGEKAGEISRPPVSFTLDKKNEHAVNEDYIYNKDTFELKNYDGTVERVVSDPADKIYYEYYNSKHTTGKNPYSVERLEIYNNQIDKLRKYPNEIFAALIPVMYVTSDNKVQYDTAKIQELLDGMEDKIGKTDYDKFVDQRMDLSPAINLSPPSHGEANIATAPTYIDQPHWSIYNALGGGHSFHDNSPFYQTYYDVSIQMFNEMVHNDPDIWLKSWQSESAFGSWWGELGFGSADFDIVAKIKEMYPDAADKIDAEALRVADYVQNHWIINELGNTDEATKAYTFTLSDGTPFTATSFNFNEKDRYDIMRAMAVLLGIKDIDEY